MKPSDILFVLMNQWAIAAIICTALDNFVCSLICLSMGGVMLFTMKRAENIENVVED